MYGDEIYQQCKTIINKRNKNVGVNMVFSAHSLYLGLYAYCGENPKFILAILRNEDLDKISVVKKCKYFENLNTESDDFIEFYNIYKSKYYKKMFDVMPSLSNKYEPIQETIQSYYEKMIEYKKKNKELEDKVKELELTVLHYENMPYSENYYKAEENFNKLKN